MRRLTLAVLVLGCLALGVATWMAPGAVPPISVTLSAQSHGCTAGCSIEPGATDKADHFAFCHVDRGGEGHIICPDSSSILQPHLNQHFNPATGVGDFCINTIEDLEACAAKK